MKKSYAKFIIGSIMLIGGGHAFAQTVRHPEISKADAMKYVKELNLGRKAKLDTIYKYKENNLYNLMTEHIKEQNKLCAIATKPVDKEIKKLYKKLRHTKTDLARKPIQTQLDTKQAEHNRTYEYYNKIKDMHIDDAFIKCLKYAEHKRNR